MAKCDGDFFHYCCCCFTGKLTWPVVIALFHIMMYSTVILFNGYNLVQAIATLVIPTITDGGGEGRGGGGGGGGSVSGSSLSTLQTAPVAIGHNHHHHHSDDDLDDHHNRRYQSLTPLGLELMIAHSISVIILASVGLAISANLLRGSKEEKAKKLKLWLVYTVLFCVLTVPYYVWRLTVSENVSQNLFENVGRWLIQLVLTNAFEGYFLGVAYSLITEMNAKNNGEDVMLGAGGDSSKFHALQSRDSQITFVGDMANLKSFSEMKI